MLILIIILILMTVFLILVFQSNLFLNTIFIGIVQQVMLINLRLRIITICCQYACLDFQVEILAIYFQMIAKEDMVAIIICLLNSFIILMNLSVP